MRNLGAVFILALVAGAFAGSLVVVQCNGAENPFYGFDWEGPRPPPFGFEAALYLGLGAGLAVFVIAFVIGAVVAALGSGPTWHCRNCGQENGVEAYR